MKNFVHLFELADSLHSAAIHLLRQVRLEDREERIGPAQLSALSVLVFGGSMTLGKLAAIEQVKPPTMVRIVQSLAEQHLVRISTDSEDRRKRNISATQRGCRLMMRARQRRIEALATALSGMSSQERDTLRVSVEVLRRLHANLLEIAQKSV